MMPLVPTAARIVVTGDHSLIRTAIARLIASERDMRVVAECANRCADLAAAMSTRPEVIVMDLDRDGRDAQPESVAQLLAHAGSCPVLVLTSTEDPQSLSSALGHGARGIVLKSRPAEVLMRGIRAVRSGEAWLEPSMLSLMFGAAPPQRENAIAHRLTPREREIVELVSLGLKNKKIGERLFITETTVRHHLTSIFNKLAVSSRLELMRYTYSGSAGPSDVADPTGTGTFVPDAHPTKLSLPPMPGRK